MAVYTLKNQELTIEINSHGAELVSLKDNRTQTEYMWRADPAYWKRTSPALFPVVGAYRNNEMRYGGKTYSLPQHGFARDMEFTLLSRSEDSIAFGLSDTEETREQYPFAFCLELYYRLAGRSVTVGWRVKNPAETPLYFSIGGHPAFNCPLKEGERQADYALAFDAAEKITSHVLGKDGVTDRYHDYPLENGKLPIAENLFDDDALIIENHQAQRVSLLDPEGKAYLTVAFDAPLFGVWSPPKKQAPFVCIEPWYGRADHERFEGTLEEREWGNELAPGETFEASYEIIIA